MYVCVFCVLCIDTTAYCDEKPFEMVEVDRYLPLYRRQERSQKYRSPSIKMYQTFPLIILHKLNFIYKGRKQILPLLRVLPIDVKQSIRM